MKFNQFLLAPYIGDGSPVEQIMWIDDLLVSISRIISNVEFKVIGNSAFIFPNPASEYIEIQFDVLNTTVSNRVDNRYGSEIKILNIYGECIVNTPSSLCSATGFCIIPIGSVIVNTPSSLCSATPLSEWNLRIDVSHLPAGIYFIKTGNYMEKFMVVK